MIKKTCFFMGLLVLLAGCASNGGKDIRAVTYTVENIRWEMIELNGEAVTAPSGRPLPWLQLVSEGERVSGFNGCNRFFGAYKRKGNALIFMQPMGSTRMACPPDVTIDRAFMKTLESVATCKIMDDILEIYNGEGDLLARLKSN
jgi:putative lipoprotein